VRLGGEWKKVEYDAGGCCDDPTIASGVAAAKIEAPPAYPGGFQVFRLYTELALDSRYAVEKRSELVGEIVRHPDLTGVRLEAHADWAIDPERIDLHHWIRYGGGIGGFLEVAMKRVIGLTFQVAFADPLGDGEIPFDQQVVLGGEHFIRNIREGRLIGRSAAVATLEYIWPVWVWLDGAFTFTLGNAFGPHLEDFQMDRLRWSAGFGFRTTGSPDHAFEFQLGLGSDTFEQGGAVDSFRFVVGARSGL